MTTYFKLYEFKIYDNHFVAILSDDSGWWTGKLENGKQGFFPGTYVKKL